MCGDPGCCQPAPDRPSAAREPSPPPKSSVFARGRLPSGPHAWPVTRTRNGSSWSPAGRGRFTPLEYVPGPGALKYLAYQVENATVNGYFADVSVRILVQPILPAARKAKIGPSSTVVQDRWVRIGGTWYRSLGSRALSR